MFRALHHFNLIVSDKEKTKAFYNGLLGLEIALEPKSMIRNSPEVLGSPDARCWPPSSSSLTTMD